MEKLKLVSVLIPVYNTPVEYLKDAINSIINQTYTNFELLILNDCSQEKDVEKTVLEYKDSRIKYFKNEKNLGITGSRNKLIELAQGEYLAIMDHDDISLPERLAKQVDFLNKNSDVGVVGCWYKTLPKNKLVKFPTSNNEIEEALMLKCAILHPSSMIRKSILIDNNIMYEQCFTPAEDYALWCKLIGKTKFANIPEILFNYRIHKANTSKVQKNKMLQSTMLIRNFLQTNNKLLLQKVKIRIVVKYYFKLFGLIPFLKIEKTTTKITIKLFKYLTILIIRIKEDLI